MTHYRPITLPDGAQITPPADQPAPILQWVKITDIVVDDRYQRPIGTHGWKTIKDIAAKFSWSCFTPVQLAPIEGGKFALIDGQHRTHAAMLCGIDAVPGQIIPIAAAEQAQAFIQVNTARIGVSRYNLLRAGLASGNPMALAADKAVSDAGCRLMSFSPTAKSRKPGDIYTVGLIMDMIKAGRARAVTTTLQAIRMIDHGGSSAVALYSDELLKPLMQAVATAPRISADALADLLRKKRPYITIEAAARLAKTEGGPKARILRDMFVTQIATHLAAEGLA